MSLSQSTSLTSPDFGVSFSPSLVGIPVATVCPVSVGAAQGSLGENAPFDFVSLPTISTGGLSSIYPASAVLADGSVTTFSSLMRKDAKVSTATDMTTTLPNGDYVINMMGPASLATIVVGSDGCQTLYSPTITTVCATTVTPLGYAPVVITDCNQYVTFSSETLWKCSPVPTLTPKPADSSITVTSITSLATSMEVEEVVESSAPGINDPDGALQRRELTYSTAPNGEIPMSLPRHLLPENQLHRRQVLVSDQGPVSTDLVLVTPALSTSASEIPPTSVSSVSYPVPSIIYDISDSTRNGGEDDTVTATDSLRTKWFSVPDVLRARRARDAARALIHKRQLSPSSETNNISISINATGRGADATLAQTSQPMPISLPVIMNTSTPSPSFEVGSIILPTPVNRLENVSPPQPTKYYIAPWQEVAKGGVPTHVKGLICYGGMEPIGSCNTPDTDGDTESCECEIHNEVWSVTTLTFTTVGTTIVSFTGGAVVSTANVTQTTNLQFQTTLTTTRTDVVGRVIKRTVSANATATVGAILSGSDEATIYATTQTTYPFVTKTLISIEPSIFSPPTSLLPVTDFPLSSVTGSLESDDTLSESVDGTVVVTSTVATETITIPPVDRFDPATENGPAETDGLDLVAGVQREAWPTDVWLADISGTPIAVETAYASM